MPLPATDTSAAIVHLLAAGATAHAPLATLAAELRSAARDDVQDTVATNEARAAT